MPADESLVRYYDSLSRYMRLTSPGGAGMHRLLAVPDGGAPSGAMVDERVAAALADLARPRVLDAGCGLGGTSFALAERLQATVEGITLSPVQARLANAEAARRGLADRCRFLVRSYDDPASADFDAVVAIESLIHSADLPRSLTALAGALRPGGRLVIVDDMPGGPATGRVAEAFAEFRRYWLCPEPRSFAQYGRLLADAGLQVEHDEDLTARVRPKPLGRLARLALANRVARLLLPVPAVRRVLDGHLGGIALERLYHWGFMQYRLLVARR